MTSVLFVGIGGNREFSCACRPPPPDLFGRQSGVVAADVARQVVIHKDGKWIVNIVTKSATAAKADKKKAK